MQLCVYKVLSVYLYAAAAAAAARDSVSAGSQHPPAPQCVCMGLMGRWLNE